MLLRGEPAAPDIEGLLFSLARQYALKCQGSLPWSLGHRGGSAEAGQSIGSKIKKTQRSNTGGQ